jgi:hypothetical protein
MRHVQDVAEAKCCYCVAGWLGSGRVPLLWITWNLQSAGGEAGPCGAWAVGGAEVSHVRLNSTLTWRSGAETTPVGGPRNGVVVVTRTFCWASHRVMTLLLRSESLMAKLCAGPPATPVSTQLPSRTCPGRLARADVLICGQLLFGVGNCVIGQRCLDPYSEHCMPKAAEHLLPS